MSDHIEVVINGKTYPTYLDDHGVQRFVPDPDVKALIDLSIKHFRGPASGEASAHYYDFIPETLRANGHPNPLVNYFVIANKRGYYGLNDLVLDQHRGLFNLEDTIEFETLHGYSVDGFYDSITSKLSNMGLARTFFDPTDGETYQDYSDHFTLINPVWED